MWLSVRRLAGAIPRRAHERQGLAAVIQRLLLISQGEIDAPDAIQRQSLFVAIACCAPQRQTRLKLLKSISQRIRASLSEELYGLEERSLGTDAGAISLAGRSKRFHRHAVTARGRALVAGDHFQSVDPRRLGHCGDLFRADSSRSDYPSNRALCRREHRASEQHRCPAARR